MPTWRKNLGICWVGVFITGLGLSQLAPVLPIYIDGLGAHDPARIAALSGLSFGITFLVSACIAPVWGNLSDRFGRKPMLLRASLGMAVVIFCFTFAPNVQTFILLRAFQGLLSGYSTACTTLIASQTDREHIGYASGMLSSAAISGMLLGPLFAGFLTVQFSVRATFVVTSVLLLLVFALTLACVREDFVREDRKGIGLFEVWHGIREKGLTLALLVGFFSATFGNCTIEPVLTLYVSELVGESPHLPLISGALFSIAGIAGVLSSPWVGRRADRIGAHWILLLATLTGGLLFLPQYFVQDIWMLGVFRFLAGLATGGLSPALVSALRRITPDRITGSVFGLSYSAHYLGVFFGSVAGGQVAALFGVRSVYILATAEMLLCGLLMYFTVFRRFRA